MLKALQCCAGQGGARERPSKGPHPLLDARNEPDGHAQGSPFRVEAMPQKHSEQVSLWLSLQGDIYMMHLQGLSDETCILLQGSRFSKGGVCLQR